MKIPFSKPYLTGSELNYVETAVKSLHWCGDGPFTSKCSELLRSMTGSSVYLVPSGSAALELSLMSLDLNYGDEVIMPSYTFPSTANAVLQMGLKPVFVDIRGDTQNLDETLIEGAVTEKTRAILLVHYAGIATNMEAINLIAKKNNLFVVEDAAHGVGACYQGKALGTLGDLGIYSFHETKNVSCGEGGAVLLNNERFRERLEIHRQKGTNRSQFLAGIIDKYSWMDRGANYLLSDILAAFLLAQLENVQSTTQLRRRLFVRYFEELSVLSQGRFQIPVTPKGCESNYHLFFIILESEIVRKKLMEWLSKKGIESPFHFVPLHSAVAGRRYGRVGSDMKMTDRAGSCLLRLPLFPQMLDDEIEYVIECVKSFFER